MTPYLTMAEIKAKYPNEWLVLDRSDLDRKGNIAGGVVVFHTTNEDEFRQVAPTIETSGIPRYHSTRPPDPDEVICTRLLIGWFVDDDLANQEAARAPGGKEPTPQRPVGRWWQFWR